ncbi:MAG: hypothetical protein LBO70_01975 [Clostridiales Family XIII bacterium]|jgi:hypothetical protein|nr:hypothetical protein [Clostridiales Family XIII bacterium]
MLFHLIRTQFRIALSKTGAAAILFTAATALYADVRGLDWYASAVVLERFVSLTGLILIASVFLPEQDRGIRELVGAKAFSFNKIIMTRLFLAVAICFLLIAALAFVMMMCGSRFPAGAYIFGAFATALFIGALGFGVSGISGNTIAGYLVAVAYFFMNMMEAPKDSALYLFSLSGGNGYSKPTILIIACAMIALTFAVRALRGSGKRGAGILR